jgi:hypothetical protein
VSRKGIHAARLLDQLIWDCSGNRLADLSAVSATPIRTSTRRSRGSRLTELVCKSAQAVYIDAPQTHSRTSWSCPAGRSLSLRQQRCTEIQPTIVYSAIQLAFS